MISEVKNDDAGKEVQEQLTTVHSHEAVSQDAGNAVPHAKLEALVHGFQPGVCCTFILRARPVLSWTTLGFHEVVRSTPVHWPERRDEEWSAAIGWCLPVPLQV